MQSTKHEIEMIQCNRQTTHLGTNTVVKHGFIFSVWLFIGKKNAVPLELCCKLY